MVFKSSQEIINMKKMIGVLFILVTACVLCIVPVGTAGVVTATGEGTSKDDAIQSALRRAVEQGVGVLIKSSTRVEDFQVMEDKIYSHSQGYVSKYDVLSSSKKGGEYTVTVKAVVDEVVLKEDLKAIGALKTEMGNPRILVAFSNKPASKAFFDSKPFLDEIYNGIVEALTDQKFRVVDKQSAERFSQQIAHTLEITDVNKAAAVGLKYHAEYTLYYDVGGSIKQGEINTSVQTRIKAQLIDNTRAQVVTSKVVETVAHGQDRETAMEQAARDGGNKVVAPMLEQLRQTWEEMYQRGSLYTVIVDGVDDADLIAAFTAKLEKFAAVTSAREIETGGGKTTFEAEYKGKRDQLDRDVLRAAKELNWKLKKVRAEGARSTWKKYL
jgi:hypothetical protein